MYWGRKPPRGLLKILRDLDEPFDTILDPFCGGGTLIASALHLNARVIGSDLNPMAVFLSKVLIQPLNLFSLKQVFEIIENAVAKSILDKYRIQCGRCRKEIFFEYIKWNYQENHDFPEEVKITCQHCGFRKLYPLTKEEIKRQTVLSQIKPEFWFPEKLIQAQRKTKVSFFHELFTGRNLAALAELHAAIEKIPSRQCRDFFNYVFTGALYSCSQMQMFSSKFPASSRGWTAPRFYLPPARKEKNVWLAFNNRFKTVIRCKDHLNSSLGFLKISNSLKDFETSNDKAFIHQADFLKFPFPEKLKLSHVLLDPPYNDDIDYMGFSEFWGSWLNMKSPVNASWNPGKMTNEQNAHKMKSLLLRIRENTDSSCSVILAYGSKRKDAWKFVEDSINSAGYKLRDLGNIYLDNPHKRKRGEFTVADRYFLLKRTLAKARPPKIISDRPRTKVSKFDLNEVHLTIRLAAFLLEHHKITSADNIREKANSLIRPRLKDALDKVKKEELEELVINREIYIKANNRLCLTLLDAILVKDKFNVTQISKNKFDDSKLKGYFDFQNTIQSRNIIEGVDFIAEDHGKKKILFCFYDKEKEDLRKEIASEVIKNDSKDYRILHFLIFSNNEEMNKCRQLEYKDNWPRGFFVCLDEIARMAIKLDQKRFGHLTNLTDPSVVSYRSKFKIKQFRAKVKDNIPVSEESKHYRLKIEASELKYIVPGQFVMIDTLTTKKRKEIEKSAIPSDRKLHSLSGAVDLTPISFLKRPFSIHRGIYENFEYKYLKNLELPQNLAPLSHTIYPSRFEIFYKVLDNGIGTNELKEIKKGSEIEVLGPLGTITDIRDWRTEGINEVHLIGGGVGMAPLIFFGQALKFYSFKLKAFIGIDKLETLLFSAEHPPTFAEDPKNAYVYVDNLLGIGLALEDIFMSSEAPLSSNDKNKCKLPATNCYHGFVTDQYKEYFRRLNNPEGVMIISCGPTPMMKILSKFASEQKITLKVLLEKRMACGIGVCMSCVCRTKRDDTTKYSRVCTDGPLFDANEIKWDY